MLCWPVRVVRSGNEVRLILRCHNSQQADAIFEKLSKHLFSGEPISVEADDTTYEIFL